MGGDQTLNLVIKAKDQASATLDKFSGKVESMGPTIKKMALIGVAAFATVAAGAYSMVQKYADAEAQTVITNQSLTNSFKGLEKSAAIAAGGLNGLIESSKKAGDAAIKLGFDDETAARSFAKLFAITKDTKKANSELAIAMDLARTKGIKLEDATRSLILMHAGNTKELKLLGIQVDDTATAEENLQAVHDATAGAGLAFSKTTKGAMEVLGVSVDNLKEKIGQGLAPAFNILVTWASNLVTKLQELDFDKVKDQAKKLFDLIDEKTGLITLLKDAWADVVLMFNEELKPALLELWEQLKPYKPFLDALVQVFGTALVIAIALCIEAIKGIIVIMTKLVSIIVGSVSGALKGLTDYFKDVQGGIEIVVEWIQKAIDKLGELAAKVPGASKVGDFLIDKVGGGINKFFSREHGGTVIGPRGMPVPIIAHGGETVIPAGQKSSGGSGLNININMNYPQFRSSDDVEIVRSQINDALRDVVRIYKLQPA